MGAGGGHGNHAFREDGKTLLVVILYQLERWPFIPTGISQTSEAYTTSDFESLNQELDKPLPVYSS